MRKYFLKGLLVLLLSLSPGSSWGVVDFSSTNADRVSITDVDSLSPTSFTIYARFNCDTINKASSIRRFIVGKAATSNAEYGLYQLGALGTRTNLVAEMWNIADGSWEVVVGTTSLAVNTEYCAFMTFNSATTTLSLFLNGGSEGTDTTSSGTRKDNGTADLYIGNWVYNNAQDHDGPIREVAMWSVVLSASERSLIENSKLRGMPLQVQPSNLIFYLPLDDHPNQAGINNLVFKDLSGNGNNGTGVDANGDSAVIGETVLSYPPKIGNWQ